MCMSLLLRGEGREPEGMRRYDGGGGRDFWHVGGPNGWTALRFLVGRFSGEAASGQGRVRRGALRMGESDVGLPRIGLEAPCLGGGGVQRCGSGGCGRPRIRFQALCLGVGCMRLYPTVPRAGSSRCIPDGGAALVVLRWWWWRRRCVGAVGVGRGCAPSYLAARRGL